MFSIIARNVAVESEYYRLRQLDERDKKVVRWLCVDNRSPFHAKMAEDMLEFLDQSYNVLAQMRALFPKVDASVPADVVEVNYIEDLFALIENHATPILKKLRARDLSSANSPEESPWLAFFLSTQYFRTKSMEHRLESVLDAKIRSKLDCDWDRVWSAMRVILACQVGASLHARLDHAAWTILEAPDEVELITSDQPLINIKADIVGPDGYAQKFALYFPISPEFALMCDLGSTAPGVRTELLPAGNARHYNMKIANDSFRQVFARRRCELDSLQ